MSELPEQGAYQTPVGEREKDFYEYLDLVLDSLGKHPVAELREAHEDFLWHIVWRLTGSDPAVFSAARRWLKIHDPAKRGGES